MSDEIDTTISDCMLSTIDNPYNPYKDFDSWLLYDAEKGYNSCCRLARIANFTDDMSQEEVDVETERAIDEIIKFDPFNIYVKVRKDTITPIK